jgi:hypothetical protein
MLCQKVYEECGSSWNGELPKETVGHVQIAGYLGQKDRHMRLLTIETESRFSGIKKSVINIAENGRVVGSSER